VYRGGPGEDRLYFSDRDHVKAGPGNDGPHSWVAWNRGNYVEHGFGLWVVETHAGGFVGDCGLTMQEVEGQWFVEAGWHVRSDLRRQGYAAEAATAVREAARAAGVEHLIAIIRPDNAPPSALRRRSDSCLSARSRSTVAPH
jgi:RimJ/RimL family protein N-acetyltransferase